MGAQILTLPIILPFLAALLVLSAPKGMRFVKEGISLAAILINLFLVFYFFGKELTFWLPWAPFGLDFSLRIYHFNSFVLLAVCGFAFLITLYSTAFMSGKPRLKQFYAYLLFTLSFLNGAVLSENLLLFFFFWEGLLLTTFGMIAIGKDSNSAFRTAIKSFVIVGVCDLCMMLGIAITAGISGTLNISQITLPITPLSATAFVLLFIGAASKAGAMPFHTWIPDAAVDAPLPFMAYLPASLEKLLGIYFLARISLDMFLLEPGSGLSIMMMIAGVVTIILAVMMALIQKDYKRLLSYHAVSQVGYMILGIGTALPVGIIGGLFHMINHALYKSCLFLTAGAVEKQAGSSDLEKLGGLGFRMPVTFICFAITAASICGVPPFNGFFSKEFVYDAALESGVVFYLCAVLGSLFTAISFLKLGHAVFLGKFNDPQRSVKEAPFAMFAPMIVLAGFCVFFGLKHNFAVSNLILPVFGQGAFAADSLLGAISPKLVIITFGVLVAALAYHLFGTVMTGSGLRAADFIHYAPGLSRIYKKAEARFFDPYDIGLKLAGIVSRACWKLDRGIDRIYNGLVPQTMGFFVGRLIKLRTANYIVYLWWSLVGIFMVMLTLIYSKKF